MAGGFRDMLDLLLAWRSSPEVMKLDVIISDALAYNVAISNGAAYGITISDALVYGLSIDDDTR